MGKRCLICLLTENNCFTEDVCEAIGGSIYNNEYIEWPDSFRVEPSPGNGGSVTFGRNHQPRNAMLREEEEREEEEREEEEDRDDEVGQDDEEESQKPDDNGESPSEPRKKKRGGVKGRKRLPMQRTALPLQQQARLLQYHQDQSVSGTKPSYVSLQEWAKEQFRLKCAPSRSLVAKLLKNKADIFAKASETLQLDRKRKRTSSSVAVTTLEKHLLEWVQHHDATHGGRIPLTDAMLVQQVISPCALCLAPFLAIICLRVLGSL
jgi:hypothetical protein